MNCTDLEHLLDAVKDQSSFLAFVDALAADRRDEVEKEALTPSNPYGPGQNGWENDTIESFLSAAVAWARDMRNTGDSRADWFPETPSWQAFARFLYLGKHYE